MIEFQDDRLPVRFWSKCLPDACTGCWLWTSEVNRQGYGRVRWEGTKLLAHRVAYEATRGPIATGLVIDHLCRTRHCVNPDHLEAVTQQENILRGTGPTANNAAKEACKNGHPFVGENIRPKGSGRECATCNREYQREWARSRRRKESP
jgi:hypothetical protein